MSELLKGLNPQQLIAVRDTVHQSALVLAGAGSGKTNAMTKRIAYLKEQGVNPLNMMAVTFTNKASKEMQERLEKIMGADAKKVTMGTFHKICIMMLKKYGNRIGVPNNFGIADPSDQGDLMRAALKDHGLDSDANSVKSFLGQIGDLKNKCLTPNAYYNLIQSQSYNSQQELLHKIYTSYQTRLKKENKLDFDDLLMEAVRLLQYDEDTRRYYQSRYRYIMVDEYQDTNPVQYELIKLLTGRSLNTQSQPANVFVVGDDYQGIYGFRGSDLDIILNFQRDFPEAIVIELGQNYRSTKNIVAAGAGLMRHNPNQMHKDLFTNNVVGEKIKVFRAYKSEEEAEFIAQEIQNLVMFGGYKHEDIAILYRTNFLSREMETQLINRRLPYEIVGGTGFYDRMEVKDTIAYLKVVANPQDDIAMRRILSITPGIGKTSIMKMEEEAAMMGVTLAGYLKHFRTNRKAANEALDVTRALLQELYMINQVCKSEGRKDPVSKMMDIVWTRTGYKDKLSERKNKESYQRLENLEELKHVAELYERDTDQPTLDDFLDGVVLNTNDSKDEKGNNVSLMTIHASKGLEYPVVFVMGMEEGILPHKNSLQSDKDIEEERRLAYVAVTRAEKLCYLSYAKARKSYQGTEWSSPSRFLKEFPQSVLQYL